MWLTAREMCSDTVLQIQDSTSRESKLPAPNPPDVTKREKQSGKDSSLMIKFCSKSLWTGHTVQASSTWWLESPICPPPCLCELVVQLVQNGGWKVSSGWWSESPVCLPPCLVNWLFNSAQFNLVVGVPFALHPVSVNCLFSSVPFKMVVEKSHLPSTLSVNWSFSLVQNGGWKVPFALQPVSVNWLFSLIQNGGWKVPFALHPVSVNCSFSSV